MRRSSRAPSASSGRRSPTCSPQRVEQAAPDDGLAGAGDHAPVADRVGPALVVAAERARPHVDGAAGHRGRGPHHRRRAGDLGRLRAEQGARARGRDLVGIDDQLVGLGAQRGVLDDAPVGRLGAQRHDHRAHGQREAGDRHRRARAVGERVLDAEDDGRREVQRRGGARGARGLRAHARAPQRDRLEHAEPARAPRRQRGEEADHGDHPENARRHRDRAQPAGRGGAQQAGGRLRAAAG